MRDRRPRNQEMEGMGKRLSAVLGPEAGLGGKEVQTGGAGRGMSERAGGGEEPAERFG